MQIKLANGTDEWFALNRGGEKEIEDFLEANNSSIKEMLLHPGPTTIFPSGTLTPVEAMAKVLEEIKSYRKDDENE